MAHQIRADVDTDRNQDNDLEPFRLQCLLHLKDLRDESADTEKTVRAYTLFLNSCKEGRLGKDAKDYFICSFLVQSVSALLNRRLDSEHLVSVVNEAIREISNIAIEFINDDRPQVLEALSISLNKNRPFYQKYGHEEPNDWALLMSDSERKFRTSFEVGKWVDALNDKGVWQQAQIIDIYDDGGVKIEFPFQGPEKKDITELVGRESTRLAPLGSKVNGNLSKSKDEQDFRKNLKIGDLVHICEESVSPHMWPKGRIKAIQKRLDMADMLTVKLFKGDTITINRNSKRLGLVKESGSGNIEESDIDNRHEIYEVVAEDVPVCPYQNSQEESPIVFMLSKGMKIIATGRRGCWVQHNVNSGYGGAVQAGWSSIKSSRTGAVQLELIDDDLKGDTDSSFHQRAPKVERGDRKWALYKNYEHFVNLGGLEKIMQRIEQSTMTTSNSENLQAIEAPSAESESSSDTKGIQQKRETDVNEAEGVLSSTRACTELPNTPRKKSLRDCKETKSTRSGNRSIKPLPTLSARIVQKLVSVFCMEIGMLRYQYARRIVPRFYHIVFGCVSKMNQEQVRGLSKAGAMEIEENLRKALGTVYSEALAESYQLNFGLCSGLKRLQSKSIERRMNGLEHISDVVQTLINKNHWFPVEVCEWIERQRIIRQCFGPASHPELMRGCKRMLYFLAERHALTKDTMDLLWEVTVRIGLGETAGKEQVFEVWKDIRWRLEDVDMDGLLLRFENLSRTRFTPWLMQLLSLLIESYHLGIATVERAVLLVWDVAQDDSGVHPSVQLHAMKVLKDAIKSNNVSMIGLENRILNLCVFGIKKHKSVSKALEIIMHIVEKYPESRPAGGYDDTRSELIEDLQTSHELIHLLLVDLTHFRSHIISSLPVRIVGTDIKSKDVDGKEAADSSKKYLADKKGAYRSVESIDEPWYLNQIQSRLQFLCFLLCNSRLTLQREAIISIWDLLHNRAILPNERESCFLWFERAMKQGESAYRMFDNDTCKFIFEDIIMKYLEAKRLGFRGYSCFERYFLNVNCLQGFIVRKSTRKQWFVAKMPLIGLPLLWSIALEIPDSNQRVLNSSVTLLNRVYQRFDISVMELTGKYRLQYIDHCMRHFEESLKIQSKSQALRCLTLLNRLLDISEAHGINFDYHKDSEPHGAKLIGKPVSILVYNDDRRSAATKLKMKSRNVHNNTTLWQVRNAIGKALGIESNLLEIRHQSRLLSSQQNSRLLKHLNLHRPIVFQVSKSRMGDEHRVPLLNDRREMVPLLLRAIAAIFKEHARAQGGTAMDFDDLNHYMQVCGVESKLVHDDVLDILRLHGDGTYVELDGFLQFYSIACLNRPDAVWEDLLVHGYRYDLQKSADVAQMEREKLSNMRLLPRTLLATDQLWFNQLFKALESSDVEVSESVWNLLMRLPTNPRIFRSLESLQAVHSPTPDWQPLIPIYSSFNLMYHLQIVEYLMAAKYVRSFGGNPIIFEAVERKAHRRKVNRSSENNPFKHQKQLNKSTLMDEEEREKAEAGIESGYGKSEDIIKNEMKQRYPSDSKEGQGSNATASTVTEPTISAVQWRRKFFLRGGYQYLHEIFLDVSHACVENDIKRFNIGDISFISMYHLLIKTFLSFTLDAALEGATIDSNSLDHLIDCINFFSSSFSLSSSIQRASHGMSGSGPPTITHSQLHPSRARSPHVVVKERKDSLKSKYMQVDTKDKRDFETKKTKQEVSSDDVLESPIHTLPPVLARQLSDSFTARILKEINWPAIQEHLLKRMLHATTWMSKDTQHEVEKLVETAMTLWCVCVLIEPVGCLPELYKIMNATPSGFIAHFLNNKKSSKIRAYTAGAIYAVCSLADRRKPVAKLIAKNGIHWPHSFFVRWLCDSIFDNADTAENLNTKDKGVASTSKGNQTATDDERRGTCCEEQYLLLSYLLKISPDTLNLRQPALIQKARNGSLPNSLPRLANSLSGKQSLIPFTSRLINALHCHRSCEKITDTSIVDRKLTGTLKVLTGLFKQPLIQSMKNICSKGETPFIYQIFSTFLFSSPSDKAPVKCCSSESRRTCFDLVIELITGCVDNFKLVLAFMLDQHQTTKALIGWENDITQLKISDQRFVGLKNMGATCYMNSVLQQLYMTTRLRYGLLKASSSGIPGTSGIPGKTNDEQSLSEGEIKRDASITDKSATLAKEEGAIAASNQKAKCAKDSLLRQLQLMFGFLTKSERNVYDMKEFCSVYQDPEGKQVNHHHQCDAQEFLSNFLSLLEKQLEKTSQKNLIKATLMGTFCDHKISLKDGTLMRETREDFLTISLQVQGLTSLQQSLQNFVTGEIVSGLKQPCRKAMCIGRLPNTVIFHLNRFTINMKTFQHEKLYHRFEFPNDIDLYPFTREGLDRAQVYESNDNDKDTGPYPTASFLKLDRSRFQFHLVGIVVHKGNAEQGHYYSLIQPRTTRQGEALENGKWIKFDDSHTLPFDTKYIASECFGEGPPVADEKDSFGMYSNWTFDAPTRPTAYMLVYERDHPLSDKELAEQVRAMESDKKSAKREYKAQSARSEEEGSKNRSRVTSSLSARNLRCEGATSGESNEAEHHDEIEQLCGILSKDFTQSVVHLIPESVLGMIEEDNRKFMQDVQMFDPDYYEFFGKVFLRLQNPKHEHHGSIDRSLYVKAVSMNFDFMLDVIARSKHRTAFASMAAHLCSLLKGDAEMCNIVLEKLVSSPKKVAAFSLICRVRDVQKNFLNIVLRAMVESAKHDEARVSEEAKRAISTEVTNKSIANAPVCVRMLHVFVDLIKDVRSNWVRMREFFAMLFGLVTEIPNLKYLLITSPLAETSLLPDMISLCTHEYPKVATRVHESQTRLMHLLPLLSALIRCCTTPADDYPMLHSESKDSWGAHRIAFRRAGLREELLSSYEFIMCYRHDRKAISDIVCHWTWENHLYQIVDRIIDAIDRSPPSKTGGLFSILRDLLQLEDTYQTERMRAFIGSDNDGIMSVIRKNASNKTYIQAVITHVLTLGRAIPTLGCSMIEDSGFSTSMIQWLKYNLENGELMERFADLAKTHGANLDKMAAAAKVWNCRACTYENLPGDANCAMCQQARFFEGQEVEAWNEQKREWCDAVIVSSSILRLGSYDIRWKHDISGPINETALHYRNLREKPNVTSSGGQDLALSPYNSETPRNSSESIAAAEIPSATAVPMNGADRGPKTMISATPLTEVHAPTPLRFGTQAIVPRASSEKKWKPNKRERSESNTDICTVEAHQLERASSVQFRDDEKVDFWLADQRKWVDATIVMVNNKEKVLLNFDNSESKPKWHELGSSYIQPRGSQKRDINPSIIADARVVEPSLNRVLDSKPRSRPFISIPAGSMASGIPESRAPSLRSRQHSESSLTAVVDGGLQQDLTVLYKEQLAQLASMGFPDDQKNLEALQSANGHVETALNSLLMLPAELD